MYGNTALHTYLILECPSALPGKTTTLAISGPTNCLLAVLPLGCAGPALQWHHPSDGGNDFLLALEVLYETMCNSCASSTSIPPALVPDHILGKCKRYQVLSAVSPVKLNLAVLGKTPKPKLLANCCPSNRKYHISE